jgi:hypothetical protein
MPSYLPPRVGITQSEAFAEAAHFAGEEPVLMTLAFYHPGIVDAAGDPMAVYVVNDFEDLTATLEDDAPLDPGGTVTFRAVPMSITLPAEGEERQGEVRIALGNVARLLGPYLATVAQSQQPIEVICRVYLGSDLTAPHELPPMRLTLRGAQATASTVTAAAGFGDVANRRFPAVEYRRTEFPGLA